MNNQFNHPKYITTGSELKQILSNCSSCFRLTLKGNLIVPLDNLKTFILPTSNQAKFCLLVNLKHRDDSLVGHWICLLIWKTHKKCIIVDPSNEYHHSPVTVASIHSFCIHNGLKEINFSTKCQSQSSFVCGQICLFFCEKMHKSVYPRQILELRKTIKSYTIPFNELHMIRNVKRHFKVVF